MNRADRGEAQTQDLDRGGVHFAADPFSHRRHDLDVASEPITPKVATVDGQDARDKAIRIDEMEYHRVDVRESVVSIVRQDTDSAIVRRRGDAQGAKGSRVCGDHGENGQCNAGITTRAHPLVVAKLRESFADHGFRYKDGLPLGERRSEMPDGPAMMSI